MRSLLLTAVATIGCLLGGSLTYVLPAQALSLAPSIIEARIQPGETKTFSIQITNDEAQPLQLYPSIQKFIPLGTQGQQQFLPPDDLSGLPSWTFVGVSDRILAPGETQAVPVEVRVPENAPTGGLYEAVFFSADPPRGSQRSVGIRSRIGVLLLVTVGDVSVPEIQVRDWRLENTNRSALQGSVHVALRNVGATHVVPGGEVVVRNMFGSEVLRLPLNAVGGRILPGSERTFDLSFGDIGAKSGYTGLQHELRSFGIGRYSLSLEGIEGVNTPPEKLTLTVFPWRTLLVLFGGVVMVSGASMMYRRRVLRSLLQKSGS